MMDAVFWGRFDPPTLSHLKIIEQACNRFSKLHLVVIDDQKKPSPVSANERVEWLKSCINKIFKINYYIQDKDNLYSYKKIKSLCKSKLAVICGDDAFSSWNESRDETINCSDYDLIYIVTRREKIVNRADNVVVSYLPERYKSISSNNVKQALQSGGDIKSSVHLNILDMITNVYF